MIERLKQPIQYASGYELDLYCDHKNAEHDFQEFPWQLTGETFRECTKAARKAGWTLYPATRTATCPKCVKRLRRAEPT